MAATAPTTSPTATQRAQGADGATTATTTAADRFYHSLTTCRGELTGKDVVVKIVDAATGEVLVDQTRTTFCTSPDRRGAPRAGSSHGCVE